MQNTALLILSLPPSLEKSHELNCAFCSISKNCLHITCNFFIVCGAKAVIMLFCLCLKWEHFSSVFYLFFDQTWCHSFGENKEP